MTTEASAVQTGEQPNTAAHQYVLEGTMLEACNCEVLCPCWIGEDPDNGTCDSFIAYNVESGSIGNVDVSALTIVGVGHIPGNVLRGNFKVVHLINDRATHEQ